MRIRLDIANDKSHAALAMAAARRVARARRRSQKEKIGHAVCHHLLRMLSEQPATETRPSAPAAVARGVARPLDDQQISLDF